MEQIQPGAGAVSRLELLGVAVVYLFGSVAEESDGGLSDLDVGIVLRDPRRLDAEASAVCNELYDLLTDAIPGRDIDIVFLQTAGLELSLDAITHGRVLFEASASDRCDFEERTMILYADFRPLLQAFDDAVLKRI